MDTKRFEETKTYRFLPEPEDFPNGLSGLLAQELPGNDFADDPLDDKDLSALLNAIESKSQKHGTGWTSWTYADTPGVGIYVVKSNGLWYWEQEKNAMLFVHAGEHFRKALLPEHRAAQGAPVELVFVTRRPNATVKPTVLYRLRRLIGLSDRAPTSAQGRAAVLECGARIQNAILACQALHLQAEVVLDFNRLLIPQLLASNGQEEALAVLAVGYQAASIFKKKTR